MYAHWMDYIVNIPMGNLAFVIEGSEDDDVEVPPHILELVATDNSQFEHWVMKVKAFRVST